METETTINTLDPLTKKHHNDNNRNVWILSTVLPFCVIVIIIITIRRVKRRIQRKKNIVRSSVYFIKTNDSPQRNFPYEPKSILPPATPTPVQDSIKGHKIKGNHVKSTPKKTKNKIQSAKSFPREPVYKSQDAPHYMVPFSALPQNFDFSLPNVEVHSDFVIIKNLDILQTYWYESEPKPEEYNKQFPLNPNFRN